ncbi:vWA domain-containing protein [Sphingobacterium hungaricum]|uniref:VWFA domain-containing protein n=1 Tax=Sphingobacterium hungaricum TaxID=2082723 RepID=A0A928YSE4_9SPHI|nr:vWA domain-containing protein [Sphingobacterium hungaricum]MBE8715170.1 hypothetical protein [Sphingobacterium hungaricum]
MKLTSVLGAVFFACLAFTSCDKHGDDSPELSAEYLGDSNNGGSGDNQPGVITAGEWNDLNNWKFWESIISSEDFKDFPAYWSFFNTNRISVNITSDGTKPVINAVVQLKNNGTTLFTARTDNFGNAELWPNLLQSNNELDFSKLSIQVNNGAKIVTTVKPYSQEVNKIIMPETAVDNKIEISFVVDATGSMGDELEYLKTELLDVISRVKTANPKASVYTSSVFYRDAGDDYVTRVSGFTNDNRITTNFIAGQSAAGGGDTPEAVHSALDKALNELQWSTNARTRLLFLLLDAPPHYQPEIIQDLHRSIGKATEKGIKIIPIAASGIDKKTEFLMRFFSLTTNGTYVFITNHSGVGNEHLEPTVGQYEVEFLNNLMVRLINKYAQ